MVGLVFVKFVTQVQTLVEHGFDPKGKEGTSIEMNIGINTAATASQQLREGGLMSHAMHILQ